VTVRARPNNAQSADDPRIKSTLTDANGYYRIDGLTEPTILEAQKDGYDISGDGAFTGDRTIDLTMHRRLWISAGESLHATIWGDSSLSGEDWTGASCDHRACVMVHVTTPSCGSLTTQLRWRAHENELGVFISTGFFSGRGTAGS
jgi:hypothetical protein